MKDKELKKITLNENDIDDQSFIYYVNEDDALMSDYRFNYSDEFLLKRLKDNKKRIYYIARSLKDILNSIEKY